MVEPRGRGPHDSLLDAGPIELASPDERVCSNSHVLLPFDGFEERQRESNASTPPRSS